MYWLLVTFLLYICRIVADDPDITRNSLCPFIAATNVATIYTAWQCSAAMEVSSDPCTSSNNWTGIVCSTADEFGLITEGSLSDVAVTGIGTSRTCADSCLY